MAAETAIGVLVVGITFVLMMLSVELKKIHKALKLLFFLLTLWFTTLSTNLAHSFAVGDELSANIISILNIAVYAMVIISVFVTGYFIIAYCLDIMINLGWVTPKYKLKNFILDEEEYGDESE